ncbi:MAG: Wzz/FepE/Etk N-terminal domain-containing protein, partial [Armatimonadota bacterium]|nr:Wzz/FepE/Etk N-terminal domain-containing protein [Armatimonadota bacterium]
MDLDDITMPPGVRALPPGAPAMLPGHAGLRDAVDMRDYVRILIKRRWVISLTALVVFATSALLVYSQPKVYRATAKVQVIQPPPVIPMPGAQQGGQGQGVMPLPTQAKRVASFIVAQKASQRIQEQEQLTISPMEIRKGLSVSIEEPDVLAISVEDTDPDRAVLVANALKDTFIETTADIAKVEARGAKAFLEAQQELVLRELNRLDAEIRRYKQQH